jgi:transposase
MGDYSTAQVAEMLGIGTDTLHRWLKNKKVAAPELQLVGGVKVRLWSDEQLAAAKRYKARHYWGRGGRKKRSKRAKQG